MAKSSQEETKGPSTLRSAGVIATCTAAMIVNTSNSTSVAIALPTIGVDLGIPEARLSWLVSSYALSSGCLLLLFGRVADLYGRKKAFMLGSAYLAAFTLACGFAKTEIALDVLRGLQGIGAAATIPASLGILAHTFPPSRARSIAFACFAAGAPIGGCLGIVIGGLLVQLSDPTWRSNFYFSAGMTALCTIGGILSIDADVPSTEKDKRLDWLGAFLVTAALVFIVFVLAEGEIAPKQWGTPYIIAMLIIGVALLAVFVLWQRYLEQLQVKQSSSDHLSFWTPPPLMKISIWGRAQGRYTVIMTIAFLQWCAFISWTYWVQLYYQDYSGLTPILTMIRLLPMSVSGVICNVLVAILVGKLPVVYLITLGTLLTSTAGLLFAVIDPSVSYWAFGFPAAIISVAGADFVFAAGTLFVAKMSEPHEQSMSGAIFQTMTQIGTSVGSTVTTIIFNRVLKQQSAKFGVVLLPGTTAREAPRPAQLSAYKAAQWGVFAFGMIAMFFTLIFLRKVGVVGHNKRDDAEARGLDEKKTATSAGDEQSAAHDSAKRESNGEQREE